jgi:hypothetical protein
MFTSIPLKFKSKLTIPFGKLQSVIDWCEYNCRSEWSYTDNLPDWFSNIEDPRYTHIRDTFPLYTFMFDDERDYIAFMLVHE